jgi:hypothetical protein
VNERLNTFWLIEAEFFRITVQDERLVCFSNYFLNYKCGSSEISITINIYLCILSYFIVYFHLNWT